MLFLRLPGLTARWLPEAGFLVPLGIALQVGFGFIAVWARRQLGKQWSPGITEKVGHQLVRSGPYRFIRHPIYTAMLGMYLGTALVSGARARRARDRHHRLPAQGSSRRTAPAQGVRDRVRRVPGPELGIASGNLLSH
jgi:hypothetical protein